MKWGDFMDTRLQAKSAVADAIDAVECLPYGDDRDDSLGYLTMALEILEEIDSSEFSEDIDNIDD